MEDSDNSRCSSKYLNGIVSQCSLNVSTERGQNVLLHDRNITIEVTLDQQSISFFSLKLPDITQTFILMTDASDRGIGAVLMQEQDTCKIPIAYASRKIKGSELAYSTIEREWLAIVWAMQKYQRYLYGKEFVLETTIHR